MHPKTDYFSVISIETAHNIDVSVSRIAFHCIL